MAEEMLECTLPTLLRTAWGVPLSRCEAGVTYGCFDGGHRMWVSNGCRGNFRCSSSSEFIRCDPKLRIHGNPTLSHNVTARFNCMCSKQAIAWPPVEETLKSMQRVKWPEALPRVNAWLGAIISVSATNTRYKMVEAVIVACGFVPKHVPAAKPQHFASSAQMLLELFGRARQRMTKMSPFEVALLVSHRRALEMIAHSDNEWGAVFEDDAILNPMVGALRAGHLLHTAFSAAGDQTFIYLGACNPDCVPAEPLTGFHGLPHVLLHAGRCRGYCTHAYALPRTLAATFFDDVFGCQNSSTTCGAECALRPCYMDWAFRRHFTRGPTAWLVGGGLRSPWASDHRGLFLQNRSSALQNNVSGTSLRGMFRWQARSLEAVAEERCNDLFGMGSNSSKMDSKSARRLPLRQVLVTPKWSGRVGNLLFEWAGLLGVAARLQASVPTSPVALNVPSTDKVPGVSLFKQFPTLLKTVTLFEISEEDSERRSTFSRKKAGPFGVFGTTYAKELPNLLRNCTACTFTMQESKSNSYGEADLLRLETWVASPPMHCEVGLVELAGYFQSYKYFEAIAEQVIRPSLAAHAPSTWNAARSILDKARGTGAESARRLLIGVQVRLGDKLKGEYRSVYEPVAWEYYSKGMRHMAQVLQTTVSPHRNISFIVTAGGSQNANTTRDIAEAKLHLARAGGRHPVFFTGSTDPYVDLAVLRACDGLVIGASSLGWWAAYLSHLPAGRVIVPRDIYRPSHRLSEQFNGSEYYLPEWVQVANNGSSAFTTHLTQSGTDVMMDSVNSASTPRLPKQTLGKGPAAMMQKNRNIPTPTPRWPKQIVENGPARMRSTRESVRRKPKLIPQDDSWWTSFWRSMVLSLTATGVSAAAIVAWMLTTQRLKGG